jgi:hypothetical protein
MSVQIIKVFEQSLIQMNQYYIKKIML